MGREFAKFERTHKNLPEGFEKFRRKILDTEKGMALYQRARDRFSAS